MPETRSISELANREIARRYKKLLKRGRKIASKLPAEETHTFRKRVKDLRYLLKFFGALISRRLTRSLLSELDALHDLLGGYQDRVVEGELLMAVASKLANDAAALLAIGALLEQSAQASHYTIAEFDRMFRQLFSKNRRSSVLRRFE